MNNASAFGDTPDGYPLESVPFWEHPVALWDEMFAVGLRSHFVAARLAAPLFLRRKAGLIVNVSSAGAASYAFNAACGAVKAGLDKLSADLAHDLLPHGVAALSLWPPFTLTEKYLRQSGLDLKSCRLMPRQLLTVEGSKPPPAPLRRVNRRIHPTRSRAQDVAAD